MNSPIFEFVIVNLVIYSLNFIIPDIEIIKLNQFVHYHHKPHLLQLSTKIWKQIFTQSKSHKFHQFVSNAWYSNIFINFAYWIQFHRCRVIKICSQQTRAKSFAWIIKYVKNSWSGLIFIENQLCTNFYNSQWPRIKNHLLIPIPFLFYSIS